MIMPLCTILYYLELMGSDYIYLRKTSNGIMKMRILNIVIRLLIAKSDDRRLLSIYM